MLLKPYDFQVACMSLGCEYENYDNVMDLKEKINDATAIVFNHSKLFELDALLRIKDYQTKPHHLIYYTSRTIDQDKEDAAYASLNQYANIASLNRLKKSLSIPQIKDRLEDILFTSSFVEQNHYKLFKLIN